MQNNGRTPGGARPARRPRMPATVGRDSKLQRGQGLSLAARGGVGEKPSSRGLWLRGGLLGSAWEGTGRLLLLLLPEPGEAWRASRAGLIGLRRSAQPGAARRGPLLAGPPALTRRAAERLSEATGDSAGLPSPPLPRAKGGLRVRLGPLRLWEGGRSRGEGRGRPGPGRAGGRAGRRAGGLISMQQRSRAGLHCFNTSPLLRANLSPFSRRTRLPRTRLPQMRRIISCPARMAHSSHP